MRKILKIAKLELNILMYSPVVWLIFPIFLILCALNLIDGLQSFRTTLSLGGNSGRPITTQLFGGQYGLFTSVQQTLYLYLPILTMGIMSRETNSGSIKLLLSSPVKLREIILGKYLALVGLGLIFIAILGLYAIIGAFSITGADGGLLIAGLFGLFLLVCTYAAIGLFMSSLTIYQIVAAIATLAVFSALRFIGNVGQSIDFVRDLTYFLSISGRTDTMVSGLISTRDVFYYLIIIVAFLSLCVLYLKNQRDLKSSKVKFGRYVVLISTALLLGYISSRPACTGYLDLTADKSMTLTENSQKIAKQIDGELKMTTYVNLLSPNNFYFTPQYRNYDLARQEEYKRFIPGITNQYVYYYHDLVDTTFAVYRFNPNFKNIDKKNIKAIAEKTALATGDDIKDYLTPATIDKMVDLKSQGYYQVRKLEYKGKSTFLRFFVMDMDQYPSEAEWMAALKRLSGEVPKMIFLTGNNESDIVDKDDRGYQAIASQKLRREAMVNQGFDVDTLNIETQSIPRGIAILVMADPTVPFSAQAAQKLNSYINEGGNMLITTDPGRQAIINPVLSKIGIQIKQGMLVKPDKDLTKDKILTKFSAESNGIDRFVDMLRDGNWKLDLKSASAIAISDTGIFKIKPFMQSLDGGWNKVAQLDINAPALEFKPAEGDQKGVFPTAVTVTRNVKNKEQRIIVSADADFLSNAVFNNSFPREKQMNVYSIFRWLVYGKFPFDEIRPAAKDIDLNVSREQITAIGIVCKFILPAIFVLIGVIVLFKRRSN